MSLKSIQARIKGYVVKIAMELPIGFPIFRLVGTLFSSPVATTIYASYLYKTNRFSHLYMLCQYEVGRDITNKNLLIVLLRSCWLLNDDQLLGRICEQISQKGQVDLAVTSFIGPRRHASDILSHMAGRLITASQMRYKEYVGEKNFDKAALELSALTDLESYTLDPSLPTDQSTSKRYALAYSQYCYKKCFAQGDLDGAKVHAEKNLILSPKSFEAYEQMADISLYFGHKELGELLTARNQMCPAFIGYDQLQAYVHLEQGKLAGFLELRDQLPVNDALRRMRGSHQKISIGRNASAFSKGVNSAFVIGRDGVADEVRWAQYYQALPNYYQKIQITCDPRLKSLFSRSFSKIEFLPVPRNWGRLPFKGQLTTRDKIRDIDLASRLDNNSFKKCKRADDVMFTEDVALRYYRTEGEKLYNTNPSKMPEPYLRADPLRLNYWQNKIKSFSDGKPCIGLIWRSGLNDWKRNQHYMTLKSFQKLADLPVKFVSLQHALSEDEYLISKELGFMVNDDVDFFNDFETVASIATSVDLVIGISTLPFEIAAAVGTESWLCAVSPFGKLLRTLDNGNYQDRLTRGTRVFTPQSARGYLAPGNERADDILDQIRLELELKYRGYSS